MPKLPSTACPTRRRRTRGSRRTRPAARLGPGAVTTRSVGEEELKSLRAVFESFDTNKNGSIDMDELQQAVTKLGISTTKEKLTAMVAEADKMATSSSTLTSS